MELVLNGITKRFGSKIAVNNLTIKFAPGIYGLLGANGAGKTTLMRMMCGLLEPTEGTVLFDNVNIKKNGELYYERLGYLPQDFGYYSDFTAKEFMEYIAALKGVDNRYVTERIFNLLENVNLTKETNKKIKTFSGGMKQRLGIAQAVLNDPSILILDEPTAGLDPKERVKFRNLISELSKDKIVILSTHIVSDIEYIADTILIMKSGKLILQGDVETVTNSINGKVWNVVVNEQSIDSISEQFCVANLHHKNNGLVEIRIISDEKPLNNANITSPTLEDLYLYHFKENGGLDDEEVNNI